MTSTPYNAIQEIRKEAFSQPVTEQVSIHKLWVCLNTTPYN